MKYQLFPVWWRQNGCQSTTLLNSYNPLASKAWRLSIITTGMAMFLLVLLLSSPLKAAETEKSSAETYRLLNLFGDVFERVRSDYVEKTSDKELIESAISGMLSALDPHSSYLNAKSFDDMRVQTRGEFGGLGIQVTMKDGLIKVISPIDDTPAFRAGIKAGDIISRLDGVPVQGLNLSEAVGKMRGRVGTDIVLTVLRVNKDPFDVTITRAVVKMASVRSRMEGDIAYLRITSFNEQASKGMNKAMAKFMQEKGDALKGVVLDLRNNPGGLLNEAIKVSDAFLDKGEIVSTRSRDPEKTQRYNAHPGDITNGLPMVVLINGGSASASEIVAGALQDHRRAIILGIKSFGKGSVQTIIPLSGQGAMRLTTARYYTPSGTSIQGIGIKPDIVVEPAIIENVKQRRGIREADLRGALENENAKDKADKTKDAKDAKKNTRQDYQLNRALDLLYGLYLYSDKLH